MVLAVAAPLVHAADLEVSSLGAPRSDSRVVAARVSVSISSMPMPPMREGVQVKYWSTNLVEADGLEIWAPR